MRRCFERFPARSQFRSGLFASHLSSSKSDSSSPSASHRSPFIGRSAPSSRTHIGSSQRIQRRDVSSTPQDATHFGQAKYGHGTGLARQNRRDAEGAPYTFEDIIRELDRYLPRSLSQVDASQLRTVATAEPVFDDVLSMLVDCSRKGHRNVLVVMVLNQHRHKAAIYLAEVLLKHVALATNEPFKDELPSNIDWPAGSFTKSPTTPIELDRNLHVTRRPLNSSLGRFDDSSPNGDGNAAMEVIWSFLAKLIIASDKRPADETKEIMNTVHQVLALIHRLGLVPASIYAHYPPRGTTTIQQPPFLHLLNSKILSTLSDVVWHVYREEVAAHSKGGEKNPWNFLPQPPGSPLRSKGRDLGPEVWIEFILWCCVEGGFVSTGTRILNSLREDENNAWQAVRWPTPGMHPTERDQISYWGEHPSGAANRHDGKPLEQSSEHKVISAEVVLAIINGLITKLDSAMTTNDLLLRKVQDDIKDLLFFMEPQDLAPAYLDYLGVRLLQTERLYGSDKAKALRNWASTLAHLRDPHSEQNPQDESRLDFDFVLARSELPAGILHQALQACVEKTICLKEAVDAVYRHTKDGRRQ